MSSLDIWAGEEFLTTIIGKGQRWENGKEDKECEKRDWA